MKSSRQLRRDATELFQACLVNGLLDENRVKTAVQQLISAKPRGYLETLRRFEWLVKLDVTNHTANVETALPLPADLKSEVQTALARTYGRGLNTSFSENPELIAGMRIRVGSDVYDGSIRGHLDAIEESF